MNQLKLTGLLSGPYNILKEFLRGFCLYILERLNQPFVQLTDSLRVTSYHTNYYSFDILSFYFKFGISSLERTASFAKASCHHEILAKEWDVSSKAAEAGSKVLS